MEHAAFARRALDSLDQDADDTLSQRQRDAGEVNYPFKVGLLLFVVRDLLKAIDNL